MASGITNPAFEENELSMLEAGRRNDGFTEKMVKGEGETSTGCLSKVRSTLGKFVSRHRLAWKVFALVVLNVSVLVYFIFATLHWKNANFEYGLDWCDGYGMLLLLLGFTYAGIFYYHVIKRCFGKAIVNCCRPVGNCVRKLEDTKHGVRTAQITISLCIFAGIAVFLILDTVHSRDRLMSCIGIATLLTLGWLLSKHPADINWRPVICGLILQFSFGLITIRWAVGRAIFQCLSDKVTAFLEFAKEGASFIFSANLVANGVFAFSVLPVIFYFSFMIEILYYLGAMQFVITKLGWVLQSIMKTTICESINCAANIFIGMSESPLLIKPYISRLTSSELHAVMCSGFASVSGSVLAAFIGFGAEPAHLLTASVMSAPASLCYSKLFYPETEKSETSVDNIKLEESKSAGLIDAGSKGAIAAIPIVLGIIANIVSFVSLIAFMNSILSWLGFLVGYDALTFEFVLSKFFMPISWLMGVPWEESEYVATLIGLKVVVNEFVAYQKLGEFKRAGKIFGRTEAIATYAICGFANPSSIGIMIASLSSMAPEKKQQITAVVLRAFVAGTAVCLLTASIAGLLISDDFFPRSINATTENPVENLTTFEIFG